MIAIAQVTSAVVASLLLGDNWAHIVGIFFAIHAVTPIVYRRST